MCRLLKTAASCAVLSVAASLATAASVDITNTNEGGQSEHAQFTIDDGGIFDAFRAGVDGSGDFAIARLDISEVPLPATLGLLGLGLSVLGALRWRSEL